MSPRYPAWLGFFEAADLVRKWWGCAPDEATDAVASAIATGTINATWQSPDGTRPVPPGGFAGAVTNWFTRPIEIDDELFIRDKHTLDQEWYAGAIKPVFPGLKIDGATFKAIFGRTVRPLSSITAPPPLTANPLPAVDPLPPVPTNKQLEPLPPSSPVAESMPDDVIKFYRVRDAAGLTQARDADVEAAKKRFPTYKYEELRQLRITSGVKKKPDRQ
jgi:hypothetical protein